MDTFINSLSGPDVAQPVAAGTGAYKATPTSFTGSLSGADESYETAGAATKDTKRTLVHLDTGPHDIGGGPTKDFKKVFVHVDPEPEVIAGPALYLDPSSPYYFRGSMSQEVLHLYLDKAITMSAFSTPEYALGDPADQHAENLMMILDVHPKFIGRIVLLWGQYWAVDKTCEQLIKDISAIHEFDPEIICQGGLMEWIDDTIHSVPFPDLPDIGKPDPFNIYTVFGITSHPPQFEPTKMGYDPVFRRPATDPDITKLETRLWYYYLATRYIDCGCEALTMQWAGPGNYIDKEVGNYWCWDLMTKIRAYAAAKARRGVVICDGVNSAYYGLDISVSSAPFARLIFDFCSLGIYYNIPIGTHRCTASNQPYELSFGAAGLVGTSIPGLHPLGWYCAHIPVLLEFDNDGHVGTGETDRCSKSFTYWDHVLGTWNDWDNINWFANQGGGKGALNNYSASSLVGSPPDLRNLILVYTYYRLKCLDKNTHVQMPGRRDMGNDKVTGEPMEYRANASAYNQQETIKEIWNGTFNSPFDWVHHNFTVEDVSNGLNNVASSLVFVGDDKIFYIATDGWIYGYVHIYDTWVGVCPSAVAGGYQVQAKSDLVASRDGKLLLYIGVDGYIYGLNIIDIWTYTYIYTTAGGDIVPPGSPGSEPGFMPLLYYGTKASGSLIFPYDLIYFIGPYYDYDTGKTSDRVWGFEKRSTGKWQIICPSKSAEDHYGWHVDGQEEAAGALTFDDRQGPNRLYYRGKDGCLYYFLFISSTVFQYVPCPANATVLSILKIQGNIAIHYDDTKRESRIYFVGRWSDGSLWAYFLIDNGSSWGGFDSSSWIGGSPTFAAIPNGYPLSIQVQSFSSGDIAVSPDGNTIACFGCTKSMDRHLVWTIQNYASLYHNIDGENYGYVKILLNEYTVTEVFFIPPVPNAANTLQFVNNSDFYFVFNNNVYHYVYQEAFCENDSGVAYPKTYSLA